VYGISLTTPVITNNRGRGTAANSIVCYGGQGTTANRGHNSRGTTAVVQEQLPGSTTVTGGTTATGGATATGGTTATMVHNSRGTIAVVQQQLRGTSTRRHNRN
jgi:hypothetical protein